MERKKQTNAGSESVMEKKMFCDSAEYRRIVIMAANESMEPVHDRMPLILNEDEIMPWLMERNKTGEFQCRVPCQLNRTTEFEQLTLFWH